MTRKEWFSKILYDESVIDIINNGITTEDQAEDLRSTVERALVRSEHRGKPSFDTYFISYDFVVWLSDENIIKSSVFNDNHYHWFTLADRAKDYYY